MKRLARSPTWLPAVAGRLLRSKHYCAQILVFSAILATTAMAADDHVVHSFDRQQLTNVYYSEGINVGDINGDGKPDVVHGPFWFEGPTFQRKFEIYPAEPQPRQHYADNFFSWVLDINGDGHNDVLAVGMPGTPAYIYQNPGPIGLDQHWTKHQVFDSVTNESPHFVNVVGNGRPELVCTNNGRFGYATINASDPLGKWTFHAVSESVAPIPYGHGLGVGDVDGDGRSDIVSKDGWYRQPEGLEGDPLWQFHPAPFAGPGGAEMHVYDVDGDGDNDVITSLDAHAFGLAWHEQIQRDGERKFRQHLIMGQRPAHSRYGLVFTELHSVNLADIDGDGLKDIVTGKTYWSHHRDSPMWDEGAVIYWFRLVRGPNGIDWVPYRVDDQAGIGRQLIVDDVNSDGKSDIVVGGMQGAHLLIQDRKSVDQKTWEYHQPKPFVVDPENVPGEPDTSAKKATDTVATDNENLPAQEESPDRQPPSSAASKRDQYPHRGLPAEEAAKAMRLPDGFLVTVCAAEAVGVSPPDREIDGVSIVNALKSDGGPQQRETLFWHFPHYRQGTGPYSIIRSDNWKLISWYEGGKELYDLENDLSETNDLADQMPTKVDQLGAQLTAELTRLGAKLPRPNPQYSP